MTKKRFYAATLMALVFGIAVVGCVSLGAANSALKGTWDGNPGNVLKLDSGKFELSVDGASMLKGTYATSGANATLTPTHLWGGFIIRAELKWYTKAELAALGLNNSDLNQLFAPWSGTVNGNKLALTWQGAKETFTKR